MSDWEKAEVYLKTCESAYAEIGSAGFFVMSILRGLRDRFNGGERTSNLYDAIMGIAL
jgi:hypothetical protein